MTTMAGTCRFAEANNGARVFALCDFEDRTVLVPISVPGDMSVRGIQCSSNSHQLVLRMSYLPGSLRRILVGLTVPLGHHLGEATFVLRLTFDSGATADIAFPRELGTDKRYALLAVIMRENTTWDGRRLRIPEVFTDRPQLGETYNVPSWWKNRA